ncbi:hypothetical protein PLESTM_001611500 [Pleodorina starrii]|nr:hypothetical protein PLESTM_001611500 [Pleodorina starrii]
MMPPATADAGREAAAAAATGPADGDLPDQEQLPPPPAAAEVGSEEMPHAAHPAEPLFGSYNDGGQEAGEAPYSNEAGANDFPDRLAPGGDAGGGDPGGAEGGETAQPAGVWADEQVHEGDQGAMYDGGTAVPPPAGEWGDFDAGEGGAAWGMDGDEAAAAAAGETSTAAPTDQQQQQQGVSGSETSDRAAGPSGGVRPPGVAPAPRPARGAVAGGPSSSPHLTPEVLAAAAAVVFPGGDPVARLQRGLVGLLLEKYRYQPMGLAELGVRLSRHPALGPLWNDPALHPGTKLRDFVEATAAAAPGILSLERTDVGGKQLSAALRPAALQRAALRRAVAAAYPGGDDVSLVRRAAAAALIDAEGPIPGVGYSLNMPALGVAVIQSASEPRQRLAQTRGSSFSLAGVLTGRPMSATHPTANGGADAAEPTSYIVLTTVGASRVARLDADRLLEDAAAGRLGDLSVVQPVKPRAAVSGPAVVSRAPGAPTAVAAAVPAAAAAAATGAGAGTLSPAPPSPGNTIPPRVKEVLCGAIPEGRPEMHAKRCLALMSAASLGGGASATALPDPPHTLRSSPCGVMLHDLGIKPKGPMRALFDEEPHVFKAGRPSPNYLIELVYRPLLELAATHPGDLAAAVEVLLQGKTYVGMRLRTLANTQDRGPGTAAAAPPPPAAAAAAAPAAAAAAAAHPAVASAAHAASGRSWSVSAPAPRGQPPDYYQRLEKAMGERLEASSASEFITRARRVVATALLRRTGWGRGPMGLPPHSMSVKEVAMLLKSRLPEAFSDQRPHDTFPVNALVLAQQMPLMFQVDKPSNSTKDWSIRLNINSLELSAGLNPTTPPTERDAAGGGGAAATATARSAAAAAPAESSEDVSGYDAYEYNDYNAPTAVPSPPPPAAAAAAEAEAAVSVTAMLSEQPARALAAALAPTIPPDLLPDPKIQIITVPYSAEHVTALSHCLSCPQIGLAAKGVGGVPALVLLYAPAVDSLKPAAAAAAGAAAAAAPAAPPPGGVLPATVYIFDATAAAAAAAAPDGSGGDAGVVLLASLRVLLEEPGVAKVVHGCEQLVPGLEHAVGCVISPLLDTRLVSEMLQPLNLNPRPPPGPDEPPKPDDGNAPELWQLPSNWQAALTTKYWDYHVAALQHASGADSSWLHRPLSDGQLGMLVRSVQHLPELWSALTWLLPRLAQFCSIARAQQCRAMMAPPVGQAAW